MLAYYKGAIFRTVITVKMKLISKSQIAFKTFVFVLKKKLHKSFQFHTGYS